MYISATFIVILCIVSLYFLPTLIATYNKKRNAGAIFVLNLLLGFTFFGWIIALVWALTKDGVIIVQNKEVK